jgi:hypothetical protein
MPVKPFIAAVCLLVFFTSCQKEISIIDEPPVKRDSIPVKVDTLPVKVDTTPVKVDSVSFLVKSSYEKRGTVVDEYNYTYDAKGRVTSKISPTGASKVIYTYNSDNTFTVEGFSNNSLVSREVNYINAFGYVDSLVRYATDTTAIKLNYDANKLPVTQKQYRITNLKPTLTNTITTEYSSASNTTRDYDMYGSQITYEYYTAYSNTLNLGLIYYPKSRYPVRKSVHINSTTTKTLNYTYTFDSSNRITGVTITDANGVNVTTRQYSY